MRAMPTMLQRLLQTAIVLLALVATSAHADALDDAKASGLIGERQDGYIGLVQQDTPASVVALIAEVNAARKQRYEQIAKQNNIPLPDVAKLAYARAVENTLSGNFFESAPGRWVRKP